MALSYDPNQTTTKKWNLTEEKTDYQTDFPTNLEVPGTINLWVKTKQVPYVIKGQQYYNTVLEDTAAGTASPGPGWVAAGFIPRDQINAQNIANQLNSKFGALSTISLSAANPLLGKASATAATYSANEQTNALNTTKNQQRSFS